MSTRFRFVWWWCLALPLRWCLYDLLLLLDVPPQRAGLERARLAQGPDERPTALGETETVPVGVEMGSPARQPPVGVGDASALDGHDTEQVSRFGANPTSHTGALWA